MSKFSDLSKGQKRCVLALFEIDDTLKSTKSTTRAEIVDAWNRLRDQGSKVGFPNWLLNKDFKNSKGYYCIPKPSPKDMEEYTNPTKKKKSTKTVKKAKGSSQIRRDFEQNKLPQEDMEYYTELNKYGIPF